jgi:hypothetical protein
MLLEQHFFLWVFILVSLDICINREQTNLIQDFSSDLIGFLVQPSCTDQVCYITGYTHFADLAPVWREGGLL